MVIIIAYDFTYHKTYLFIHVSGITVTNSQSLRFLKSLVYSHIVSDVTQNVAHTDSFILTDCINNLR
jgi:hypothetical protein